MNSGEYNTLELLHNGSDATYLAEKTSSAFKLSSMLLATNSSAWAFLGSGDDFALKESAEDAYAGLPDGTGYLRVDCLEEGILYQVPEIAAKFNELGLDTLIIDLRYEAAVSSSAMQAFAGCFPQLAGKLILSTGNYVDTQDLNAFAYDAEHSFPEDTKVYVMAGNYTNCVDSCFIGALICYGVMDYSDVYMSVYSDEYCEERGIENNGSVYDVGVSIGVYYNPVTGSTLELQTGVFTWVNNRSTEENPLGIADGCTAVDAPFVTNGYNEELAQLLADIAE